MQFAHLLMLKMGKKTRNYYFDKNTVKNKSNIKRKIIKESNCAIVKNFIYEYS